MLNVTKKLSALMGVGVFRVYFLEIAYSMENTIFLSLYKLTKVLGLYIYISSGPL